MMRLLGLDSCPSWRSPSGDERHSSVGEAREMSRSRRERSFNPYRRRNQPAASRHYAIKYVNFLLNFFSKFGYIFGTHISKLI